MNPTPQPLSPHRIAVLMGGSTEREVSLTSGRRVAEALETRGHQVDRIDLSAADAPLDLDGVDACFLALHGGFGEGGVLQARLEAEGVPYTGSGPRASRLALDKPRTKALFRSSGLPSPEARVFDPKRAETARRAIRIVGGYPVVLKPVAEGSSIGVEILDDDGELDGALDRLAGLESLVLAEPRLEGRELTVGILDDEVLPPIELRPRHEFFDYEAKYDAEAGTEYVVDPDLGQADEAVREVSLEAHRVLGCRGMSRVDLFLCPDGPQLLEVNTIPGFTPKSLLPQAARAVGLAFPALCERLVALALRDRSVHT